MTRGRAVLAGLLGCFGGAMSGLLLAMLVVYLWFDVFHLPALDDDPKPGIAMLGGVVPIAMGIGAIAGTLGMVRRARRGRPLRVPVLILALAILIVLGWLGLIVS